MKKGNRVVMVGGSGKWYEMIYTIRSVTTDGKKVRLNQAVGGNMWQDIERVRLATKEEKLNNVRSSITE